MPTYEYRCDQCDRTFDVVQSFHDDPLTECPTCGAPVRKVFGNVGIVFKGSGFYKTDSRSGGSKSPRDSSSAASGDGNGKSADPKPAESTAGTDKKADTSGAAPAPKASPDKAAST